MPVNGKKNIHFGKKHAGLEKKTSSMWNTFWEDSPIFFGGGATR